MLRSTKHSVSPPERPSLGQPESLQSTAQGGRGTPGPPSWACSPNPPGPTSLLLPFLVRDDGSSEAAQEPPDGAQTGAAACLIAPTTQRRILWRQGARPERLKIANALAIAGTALLAAGMACVIFLIMDFIYGAAAWAAGVGGTVVAVFGGLWFLLPLYRRRTGE